MNNMHQQGNMANMQQGNMTNMQHGGGGMNQMMNMNTNNTQQNSMGGGIMADMGNGSGYGVGGAMAEYGGGYGMGGRGGGDDGKSCVMIVYGLEPPTWNCDKVFNLICQYGNVNKIFFMKSKPNTAMVEMGTSEGVENVMNNLSDTAAFGERIKFDVSKKHVRIQNQPPEFSLNDGTSSVKVYTNERNRNRFISADASRKNRIVHPTKVLHFFNIPRLADSELEGLFITAGAKPPIQVKWLGPKDEEKKTGVGLIYFDSVQDATEACILVNHAQERQI